MFKKILIANRGAIACRIIRTLKMMHITSVAVYAEADADSLHVSQADEAWSLGEGTATETYLDQDKLFAIMQQTGVEAVHPGYGFLSENPDFVQRCEQQGIVFLGPTTKQMSAFGLKHSARELAENNEVPLLPGSVLLTDVTQSLSEADRVGYPVMLKSTAGGGGIGMQLCWNADELSKAYESVKRLSISNFSNDGLFIEKFVEQARHIEVQIFGDGQGNVIALGERDCSTQRRNQKVIEETPAPNIPDDIRTQMREVAMRLGAAVNYRSAGTVEFVYDPHEQRFYFLEVNTRLQVEHGVTEQIYHVDLIDWMVKLGAEEMLPLSTIEKSLHANGHSIQVRLYAEDPHKNFQPCAGLLSQVKFPQVDTTHLRIEHWIESGVEVSALFDPMLAKIIVHEPDREQAIASLTRAITELQIYGIETNRDFALQILQTEIFKEGKIFTRYLNDFHYQPAVIDVLVAGTQTSIQDFPGRTGYWDVGVPPSGPFDALSFRLGNRLLGNAEHCAGLELTLNGPTLRFNTDTTFALTGAQMHATLDGKDVNFWEPINAVAGQTLRIGKLTETGARAYLMVNGGIQCPDYLDSKSTFTLGQFGGHAGRLLKPGDVLRLKETAKVTHTESLPVSLLPAIEHEWTLHVIYGPHAAPDFFTEKDMAVFFQSSWEVHYNSSRTGVRLIGPKPDWARSDGGEAGMHPSNIHDNAYAIGAIDFTGDMPVILGPDGPSLGGFVCPATVVQADLWKLGQLKAGDKIKFVAVTIENAVKMETAQLESIATLKHVTVAGHPVTPENAIIKKQAGKDTNSDVVYRVCGDHYLLIEYGPEILDINLRFRVHALMLWLRQQSVNGILELTPGIRSLQVHYNSQTLSLNQLLDHLARAEAELADIENLEVESRIVHLPLSWNDEACTQAIEKYMQSVRKDAPWCPSNLEFIRRINGLDSVEAVKKIVFDASYVVMGLGDVYLGAPVATPLDPRHRLVTTKYNPARTWTAENSVGIGGSYLCVYGMEGPGGYQFVGRTLQMWNRYRQTKEFTKPWLLRFFDQIHFYEVGADELKQIRHDFPKGQYPIKIEPGRFNLKQYNQYLLDHQDQINTFTTNRKQAFDAELQRWIESGQINFETEQHVSDDPALEEVLGDNNIAVESHVAGNIWKILVEPGDTIIEGQALLILESMKMEIEVCASEAGIIKSILKTEGNQVSSGQRLMIMELA
jgi:urea carboxylase